MTRLLLTRIDQHTAAIHHLEQRIEQKTNSLQASRDLLTSIPGISRTVADIIIAETGGDMTAFPTAAHLSSWAGVSPGQHESAGRRKTAPTRPGNRHLKAALSTAAMSITRQRNTYLCAKYRRIATRRGKLKAIVAIQRAILTATWHMLSTGAYYQDPGPTTTTPTSAQPVPCATSAPSATRSPFTPSQWPTSQPTHQFRINETHTSGLTWARLGPNDLATCARIRSTRRPGTLGLRLRGRANASPPIWGSSAVDVAPNQPPTGHTTGTIALSRRQRRTPGQAPDRGPGHLGVKGRRSSPVSATQRRRG